MKLLKLRPVRGHRPNSGPVGRKFVQHGNLGGFRSEDDLRMPQAKPLPVGVEGHTVGAVAAPSRRTNRRAA